MQPSNLGSQQTGRHSGQRLRHIRHRRESWLFILKMAEGNESNASTKTEPLRWQCTAPMHSLDSDGVSFLASAIRCAAKFLQNKIIQSENDLMGMVLFGTVSPSGRAVNELRKP